MLTLVTRKAVERWAGRVPPPEVAAYVNGRPVTWAEVMRLRRERQAQQIAWKRQDYQGRWRPVLLSVRYYDMMIMGGWCAMLYSADGYSCWLNRDGRLHHADLMRLLPLPEGELFGPTADFYEWCRLFASAYQTGRAHRRPRGRLILWARMTGERAWAQPQEFALRAPGREG